MISLLAVPRGESGSGADAKENFAHQALTEQDGNWHHLVRTCINGKGFSCEGGHVSFASVQSG